MRSPAPVKPNVRLPAPERLFLLVLLMVSGTVTVPQAFAVGFMSGLGLWTVVSMAIAWGLWLMKPQAPRAILPALIPLAAFTTFATFSALWGVHYDTVWIQLLAVTVAFLGYILLTSREVASRPAFAEAVLSSLDFATVAAGTGYALTIVFFGFGNDAIVGGRQVFMARPFALFALIAVARQLARWHTGDLGGLVVALCMTVLVFLSQSRLGLVMITLMYPVSFALLGGRRNLLTATMMLGAAAFGMVVMLTVSETMYERFFGHDASLNVGGVAINAEGRTAAWTALLDNIRSPMELIFGQGAGAASTFCTRTFENIQHPHNDYIRYLYDFGIFGLSWFVAFMIILFVMLWRRLRAAIDAGDRQYTALTMTTLLAFCGVAASMFTDNSANYIFVMSPLAVLIGTSLARPAAVKVEALSEQEMNWMFAPESSTASGSFVPAGVMQRQ